MEILDDLGSIHQVHIQKWDSRKRCLEILAEYKNVTCLMGRTVGEYCVSTSTIVHDKPVMKIMSDCLWAASTRMILKKGSPYLREVNIILDVAKSSGIIKRFVTNDLSDLKLQQEIIKNTKSNGNNNELIEPEGSSKPILLKIILIGFGISTIVFFAEVFCSRFSIFKLLVIFFYKY